MSVDLLTPLDPPREDVERLSGTIGGNTEGLGAGLEIWCGPLIGWRALGELLGGGQAVVCRWRRPGDDVPRMLVSLTFDLGEAPPMRRHIDDEAGA